MRKWIGVVALLVIVVSAVAYAGGGKREEMSNKVQSELKKIDKRLKLNADQKTQIGSLLDEQADKLDALYAEVQPREDAIVTEYRGKIRNVLTPAQQTEWDKIKAEYKQKWTGEKPANKK